MFHKFKTTTYATLLLIGVFVLPYAGNVADVNAENYGCKGKPNKVRQCFMEIIRERDNTIAQMQDQLKVATSDTGHRIGPQADCMQLRPLFVRARADASGIGSYTQRVVDEMYMIVNQICEETR